jgi:hypothetical protein
MDTTNPTDQTPPTEADAAHRTLAAVDPADAPGPAEELAAGLAAELESDSSEEEDST